MEEKMEEMEDKSKEKKKVICVSKELWRAINHFKINGNFKTMESVLRYAMDKLSADNVVK